MGFSLHIPDVCLIVSHAGTQFSVSYPNAESLRVASVFSCPRVRWQCLQVLLTSQRENLLRCANGKGWPAKSWGNSPGTSLALSTEMCINRKGSLYHLTGLENPATSRARDFTMDERRSPWPEEHIGSHILRHPVAGLESCLLRVSMSPGRSGCRQSSVCEGP